MTNYKIDILNYTSDNSVRSDCSDITFYNNGTAQIVINNAVTLIANQSLTINANENEIDRTIYNFRFDTTGGQDYSLVVFRKVYI